MSTALLVYSIALCVFLLFLKAYIGKRNSNPSGLPYPPGPKPLPVIGNLLDIPKTFSYKTYTAWKEHYGELIHLTVLGDHVLIINSERVATDLLEKRSKYSDRPVVPMVYLTGWDWNIGLRRYDHGWRRRRREFHEHFQADKTVDYHPTITKNANILLDNLLRTPEDFASHIRHYLGVTIMSVVYDYEVAPKDDRFIRMAEEAVAAVGSAIVAGTVAVNMLPMLQYLPAWLPGMEFKRVAQRCKKLTTEMKNAPMEFVRARMESGVSSTCVATELINRLSDPSGRLDAESEDIVKDVTAIAYAAGADTTSSSIKTGFLAMILYPEAKEKAQREIDTVVGYKRLPVLEDRASLPYVEAFFREVLRYHPPLPTSAPHATYEDDIYDGQFISKGTTVIMNTWAIHHDEDIYPEPYTFKPERFLNPDGSISDRYPMTVFGMGRRQCPGRHVADTVVWAALALVLAAFDVRKAKDESGREIDVGGNYRDGATTEPLPFVCSIEPRSRQVESLVREACADVQNE